MLTVKMLTCKQQMVIFKGTWQTKVLCPIMEPEFQMNPKGDVNASMKFHANPSAFCSHHSRLCHFSWVTLSSLCFIGFSSALFTLFYRTVTFSLHCRAISLTLHGTNWVELLMTPFNEKTLNSTGRLASVLVLKETWSECKNTFQLASCEFRADCHYCCW